METDSETIEWLLAAGLSPAQTLDYWAVEHRGLSTSEWARRRDVSRQAVSRHVLEARKILPVQ